MKMDRIVHRITGVLWGLTLFAIPVTSFPFFPIFGRETQVRPLSLYPMLVLLPLLLFLIWRRKIKPWNDGLTLLLAFGLVALLATVIGALFAPLELRGQVYWGRSLRAWITLFIGLIFLLYTIWMNRSEAELRASLKWLYAGLLVSFLWGGVQYFSLVTSWLDREVVSRIQDFFSISSFLVRGPRVSGFALEPSWLAGQLGTLYLPWLFASLLTGYRVSRRRWIEPMLFALAVILMILTYSRSGLLIAIVAGVLTALFTGRAALVRLWDWWRKPFLTISRKIVHRSRDMAIRLSVIVIILAVLAGSFLVFSQSYYFSQIWHAEADNLFEYLLELFLGPRIAYSFAALDTFYSHPLTGVGLGASGFYLFDHLPEWSRTMQPEIAMVLSPGATSLANPKNFYLRLLSETGIFGFFAFMAFFLYVLAKGLSALAHRQRGFRFLGVASLFTWVALAVYFITQDSFAMPNMWVNIGILLGMVESSRILFNDKS